MTEPVAVLGAGPMGLAAAYQLCKDGHKAIVYEADDRVGGMSACFDFNGVQIERYYHFHCLSDRAFLDLLDELDLTPKMRWAETRMGYWFQDRLQPWGNPVALLKFKGLSPVAKLRYGLHAFLCTKRDDWRPLDTVEATRWVRSWVGAEAYEVLWQKLFDYKFYDYAQSLSAAWIWSRVRRIGRSRSSLFREQLGYLEGGSATLLNALQKAVGAMGGEIRLQSPVDRIALADGKVQGLCVGAGRDARLEPYTKVISTVPLPHVPRLLPDLPPATLAQYRALKNIAVVCVIAKLKRSVSPNFWVNTNDPEMDIPGFVEYSNLRPLPHTIIYVPFYMPGEHPKFSEPDSVFIDKVKRYMQKINPTIGVEDFLELRASRYRHAQPICEPGHLQKLPPAALPITGLWVADTSYYYPEDRGISESIAFGRHLAQQAVA